MDWRFCVQELWERVGGHRRMEKVKPDLVVEVAEVAEVIARVEHLNGLRGEVEKVIRESVSSPWSYLDHRGLLPLPRFPCQRHCFR